MQSIAQNDLVEEPVQRSMLRVRLAVRKPTQATQPAVVVRWRRPNPVQSIAQTCRPSQEPVVRPAVPQLSDAIQPAKVVRKPIAYRVRSAEAEKEDKKLADKIARYIAAGKFKKAKQFTRLRTCSYNSKLTASYDANKKLPRRCRVSREQIHKGAKTMDLRRPENVAQYRPDPKTNGGYRLVMNFNHASRARQLLVKRCALPFLHIRPDQHAVENGGGIPAAARRIAEYAARGYVWFAEVDVKKCYASLEPEGVKELLRALPKEVVVANALSTSVQAIPNKTTRKMSPHDQCKLRKEAQTGIPTGSLLSPLVAEAAIATVVDQATQRPEWPDVISGTYVDNLYIVGRSKAEVEQAVAILRGAFSRSRFGSLALHCKPARSIRQGFNFLGFRFKEKRERISVEVSRAARLKFLKKLGDLLEKLKKFTITKLKKLAITLSEIKDRARAWGISMDLRQDGSRLTHASQWVKWVLLYALGGSLKLRGQELRQMADHAHRDLHTVGLRHAIH